jgi:predicted DNA-binding WGR domain protein
MRKHDYWENPLNHRYYSAHLQRDLFGDWVVMICWGKRDTKLGRLKSVFCETEEMAIRYLKKIARTRVRHGYIEIMREGLGDAEN